MDRDSLRLALLKRGEPERVRDELRDIIAGPRRAAIEDFAALLSDLALIYWRPDFSPKEAMRLNAQYVEDLQGVTREELAEACKAYRRNEGNNFYPTPGKLLALVKDKLAERMRCAAGAQILIGILDAPPTMNDALGRGGPVGDRLFVLNEAMKAEGAKHRNLQEVQCPPNRPSTGRDHTNADELLQALSKKTGTSPEEIRAQNPLPRN